MGRCYESSRTYPRRGGAYIPPSHRAAGGAAAGARGAGPPPRACDRALESKGRARQKWWLSPIVRLVMKARSASGAVHPDIVPSDVLALEAARGLRAGDCALVLDGYLRRLVRQEARARRILGTLARAFLRRHHHHDLGFARLRDYTRERLGGSARALQTLPPAVEGVAPLPAPGVASPSGA